MADGDRGTTTIRDAVVSNTASRVCAEARGAGRDEPGSRIPGDSSPTVGEFLGNLTGGSGAPDVSVEVGETETAVDVRITVDYGQEIPQVTGRLRDALIKRIEETTGLRVTEVNIDVKDIVT